MVTNGGGVAGDGSLLDIVTSLGTGDETLVTDNSVDQGVDTAASGAVKEGTGVHLVLLEGEVDLLGTLVWGIWVEKVLELDLDWLVEEVGKLDLGVKKGGSGETLGDGDTWTFISQVYDVCVLLVVLRFRFRLFLV